MMKRTILCLLIGLLLFSVGKTSDSTGFDLDALAEDSVFLANIENPSESILGLERNADVKRYPASTTKILTCIVALEQCEPDEPVTVGKSACRLTEQNSKMGLIAGEVWPMIDLLYGLMLPSGNDAAIAIAEHIGGSVAGFADLMNEKAEQIGMTNSHFTNPHGLHNDEHYTTARDMAILGAYAMQNETFAEIVAATEYTAHASDGRELLLKSSNRLLRDASAKTYTPYPCRYEYAIGIKTGDTHLAGKCLVAAARRNETTYILVLLHGKNAPASAEGLDKDVYSVQRFYDAAELFDYAFREDVVSVSVADLIDRCLPETYALTLDPTQYTARGVLYRIEWDASASLVLPRWQADAFARDPFPEENLIYRIPTPVVPVGTKAGTVSIVFENRAVFSADLIVDEYDLPPTPAPTEEPTYQIVTEVTVPDEPTPMPIPSTSPEPDFFALLFRLLSCAPTD